MVSFFSSFLSSFYLYLFSCLEQVLEALLGMISLSYFLLIKSLVGCIFWIN